MASVNGNVVEIVGTSAKTVVAFTSANVDQVNGFHLVKAGAQTVLTNDEGDFTAALVGGVYLVDINHVRFGEITVPDDEESYEFTDLISSAAHFSLLPAGSSTPSARLIEQVASGAVQMIGPAYDSRGVVTTASVVWPDGSSGTLTVLTKNVDGDLVDSFQVTHSGTGATITQAAVTRNGNRDITSKPALVVT